MHHRRLLSNFLPRDAASLAALETRLRTLLPPPAAAILDSPLWKRLQDEPLKNNRDAVKIFTPHVIRSVFHAAQTGADRHEASVAMAMLNKRLGMILRDFCEGCCYSRPRCICDAVGPPMRSRHTLWLYQNVGEFGRQNNSGRLLPMLLEGSRISTQGLRCEVDELMRHADENRDSALVLFPSPEAITTEEFLEMRAGEMGKEAAEEKPLTIFVPDGTSSQAKNIEKKLPSYLPRVRLRTEVLKSWLNPIRKQTEEHRVCTAQAGAAFLAELGETEIAERAKELVATFVSRAENDRMIPACRGLVQSRRRRKAAGLPH